VKSWHIPPPPKDDSPPPFVRLSLAAVSKLRLHENAELSALVELHAKEKQALHEQVGALSELVAERLDVAAARLQLALASPPLLLPALHSALQ
jgi:hypothetical protein